MTSTLMITAEKKLTLKLTVKHLVTLLLVSLSLECSAFGALFTTPQQREMLDQQRAQGNMFSAESKTTPKTQLSPGAGSTTGQKVFFNGYVIRKSGLNTAWANQKKLEIGNDKEAQSGISVRLNDIKGTSVPIKTSPISNSTRLQPGQFLNKTTGEITEGYHLKRSIPEVKKIDIAPSCADTAAVEQPETEPSKDGSTEIE